MTRKALKFPTKTIIHSHNAHSHLNWVINVISHHMWLLQLNNLLYFVFYASKLMRQPLIAANMKEMCAKIYIFALGVLVGGGEVKKCIKKRFTLLWHHPRDIKPLSRKIHNLIAFGVCWTELFSHFITFVISLVR